MKLLNGAKCAQKYGDEEWACDGRIFIHLQCFQLVLALYKVHDAVWPRGLCQNLLQPTLHWLPAVTTIAWTFKFQVKILQFQNFVDICGIMQISGPNNFIINQDILMNMHFYLMRARLPNCFSFMEMLTLRFGTTKQRLGPFSFWNELPV